MLSWATCHQTLALFSMGSLSEAHARFVCIVLRQVGQMVNTWLVSTPAITFVDE